MRPSLTLQAVCLEVCKSGGPREGYLKGGHPKMGFGSEFFEKSMSFALSRQFYRESAV